MLLCDLIFGTMQTKWQTEDRYSLRLVSVGERVEAVSGEQSSAADGAALLQDVPVGGQTQLLTRHPLWQHLATHDRRQKILLTRDKTPAEKETYNLKTSEDNGSQPSYLKWVNECQLSQLPIVVNRVGSHQSYLHMIIFLWPIDWKINGHLLGKFDVGVTAIDHRLVCVPLPIEFPTCPHPILIHFVHAALVPYITKHGKVCRSHHRVSHYQPPVLPKLSQSTSSPSPQ